MSLIKTAVRWPHGTFVLFVLLALLGILALLNLPLELQPGGDRPEITITTPYLGAAPVEVEDLVTRQIEEQMEQVQGVQEVSSTSRTGVSVITLEFEEGSNLNDRLVDVINRLQQADSLPEEADESNVELVGGNSSPMMWIPMLPQEGFKSDADHYRDLVEEVIVPRLRQVNGVGQFIVSGGRQREVEVLVNPQALTDRNLTIGDVVRVLRENNRDIRGGPLELGRREYRVRTLSRSQDLEQIEAFILRRDPSGTVYLRDVATVQMGRRSRDSVLVFNDAETVVLGIIRQVGANVPNVARGVRSTIAELEAQFNQEGEGIRFIYNYDESEYINQAIAFVQGNLVSGALLAAAVLLLFLGSMRTVAVIALTIPTSLIMTFTVMHLFGRTLNINGNRRGGAVVYRYGDRAIFLYIVLTVCSLYAGSDALWLISQAIGGTANDHRWYLSRGQLAGAIGSKNFSCVSSVSGQTGSRTICNSELVTRTRTSKATVIGSGDSSSTLGNEFLTVATRRLFTRW